jgi:hypothetical protein
VWPWNFYAVKNYGFDLEWHGHVDVARALYRSCLQLHPWERGCALHGAFAAPPLLRDERHAYDIYIRVLAEAHDIMSTVFVRPVPSTSGGSSDSDRDSYSRGGGGGDAEEVLWVPIGSSLDRDPQLNVRELQLHYQYMGVLPGVLAEAYSLCLLHLYPVLAQYIPPPPPPPVPVPQLTTVPERMHLPPTPSIAGAKAAAVRVVRVGVFSEHEGNSSPGLCVTRIFDHLMTAQKSSDEAGTLAVRIHLVFFCRLSPVTVFAAVMRRVADKVRESAILCSKGTERAHRLSADCVMFCLLHLLITHRLTLPLPPPQVIYVGHDDLDGTRAAVVGEQLDVLLYLALPTEKFTVFISAARLAPIQVLSTALAACSTCCYTRMPAPMLNQTVCQLLHFFVALFCYRPL